MSRVVFLDIDGVLNAEFWNESHQKEISDGQLIDRDKVKLLAQLIDRTDARRILPLRKSGERKNSVWSRQMRYFYG